MFYSIESAKSAVTRNTIKVSCRQRRKKIVWPCLSFEINRSTKCASLWLRRKRQKKTVQFWSSYCVCACFFYSN